MSPMSISLDNSKSLSIGLFLLDLFSLGYKLYVWFSLDYYSLTACLKLEKSTSSSRRGLRIWRMWYHIAPSRWVRITPANAVVNFKCIATLQYTGLQNRHDMHDRIHFSIKNMFPGKTFIFSGHSWPFLNFLFVYAYFRIAVQVTKLTIHQT